VAVSFIGGGNQCIWRKPPTCRHVAMNGVQTYNFRGDETDCIDSYKSNYHMIRTMMAPDIKRRNIVKDILNVVVKILNITGQVTRL
jgi:hypothetical protein